MKELTVKQKEIFDFILQYQRDEGVIPTIREICNAFGFSSTNAANVHLNALAKKGFISRKRGLARNIEIAPDYLFQNQGIPIIGQVAAGAPIDAIENLEGYLNLDAIYTQGRYFALRIAGDSMIDAGLWDGDYAIVRQQCRVESGEIGVAVIDGEATVKRFRWLQNGLLELVPENDRYKPFNVDPQNNFCVAGKVVGMHRIMR